MKTIFYASFVLSSLACISASTAAYGNENNCDDVLTPSLVNEIHAYEDTVRTIIDFVRTGTFKRKTYDELSKFVDKFGPRPSGSDVLEKSIDYMIRLAKFENLTDVITEKVEVPYLIRGLESLEMIVPWAKKLSLIGLGTSVSTPPEGITAEVMVVNSFDQLNEVADTAKGKIVVFDPKFISYENSVIYRLKSASKAAEKGAVAALVRSIAPFSINSPHTGAQIYDENVKKIPVAAITLEDADLLRRKYDKGEKVILKLKMFSSIDKRCSRNTIVDLPGRELPEKHVIVSGHIDSWDVGQGAMDDGGGMIVSWAVPVVLKRLGLTPRRTIRAIFWTSEEPGLIGAAAYEEKHRDELDKINFIMESDEGTFAPLGLVVGGSRQTRCVIGEILKLFKSINASALVEEDNPGSDITVITSKGVPGAGLLNANERYFWFHHSEGDMMNVEDPDELDLCTAFMSAISYIIADLSIDIPR